MDHVANPIETKSITNTSQTIIRVSPFGSVSIQVIVAAGGLSFAVQGSNDVGPQKVNLSNLVYALNGDRQDLGTACAPATGDVIDIVLGNLKDLVLTPTAGTGTLSCALGNGLKLI